MSALDLLAGLARANVSAGAVVVAVALLRKPVRRAFGAQAAYLMWIAPVLAGAAALVPPASSPAPLLAPVAVEAVVVAAGGAVEDAVSAAPRLPGLLLGLWAAGVGLAASLLLWRQARFVAGLGRLTPIGPGLFRSERGQTGPAVVGALRPRIVTPADFEARFDPDEREVILAHEGAHLRAGDARINALAALLLCACWFNPLAHLAAWLMRLDQELACDAAVVARFPKARRLYAEVLLKTQLAAQPLPFGCLWPPAAEHPLKERIVMLKSPLPARARRLTGVATVALLSAAGAAAAWAAQPGQPKPAALVKAVAAATPALSAQPAAEAIPATPAVAATAAVDASASAPAETPNTPTQAEALAQAGPDDEVLCKPGTDWTRKNCRIERGKTFAETASPADIAREWPAEARAAGQTARVMLECTPNAATHRLDGCGAVSVSGIGGAAPPAAMNAAFEQAAARVAGRYRLNPGRHDAAKPFFMTVDFSERPVVAGRAPMAPVAGPGPHGPNLPVWPDWILRPDGSDVSRVYPPAAAAAKQEGRATIACHVEGDGRLSKCQMITEAPAGAGFGDAALALAAEFQMKSIDKNGRPTAGQDVRIPFKFSLPGGETAAPAKVSDAGALSKRVQLARLMGVQVASRPDVWPPR